MSVAQEVVLTIDSGFRNIVPPEKPRMADWLRDEFTDRRGVPFQETQVPWVTAPNGPCDAIDNPEVQEIWLQWAARMFKTTLGQAMQCREAQYAPKLQMFATRNEGLCKQVLGRLYESLEMNPYFAHVIPGEKQRNSTSVSFGKCRIAGTWAGSKSGLADESIEVGHANEVDKWDYPSTSEEGDPLPRFLKRGGEFPDRKFLIESTPGQHGVSRIERGRENGSDCRYWVPCPHCGRFQQIIMGDGREPPGIFWEHDSAGHSSPEIAERTAYYVCAHCNKQIDDEHRFEMVNLGVWVPAGCKVHDDKAIMARQTDDPTHFPWLKGTPLRSGRIYSSQLSVFHALFHGWGEIAADYLRKRNNEADWRQWVTEEAGHTWRPKERKAKATWKDLAERMIRPGCLQNEVPTGFSVVTVQFDRQSEDASDQHLPWKVLAWDHERRCHIVDYGYCVDADEGLDIVLRKFPHQDGGAYVKTSRVVLDSGFEPNRQMQFARAIRKKGIRCDLVKGSSQPLDMLYRGRRQPKDRDISQTPGELLVFVDSLRSQSWVEMVLLELDQDDPEGLSVYDAPVSEHEDLCVQLLNEDVDDKGKWDRIDHNVPNDYRDLLRYGKVAIERECRGRAPRVRVNRDEQKRSKERQKHRRQSARRRTGGVTFLDRAGGWI